MKYAFQIIDIFSSTRSAVINWRFCLTLPAFRPKACRRLLVNSISAKRPSSCRRTIREQLSGAHLYTSGGARFCATSLGRHSLCSDGSRFAGAAESKNAALRPAFTITSSTSRLVT